MKAIRVSLYVIAGVLVLLVLGGAIFALTFDPNRYKDEIERLVKERTGRTLRLAGDLEVALWPSLGARVNGVSLSERTVGQEFLAVDSAHASVALMPLLGGRAIVDAIRVSGLKARVVKEKDGTYNFSDLLEGGEKPPGGKPPPRPEEKGASRGIGFDIGTIVVENSAITYLDRASGQELSLTGVKLATGRIAERADGKLEIKATLQGRNPDMDAKLDVGAAYRFDLPAKSFALSGLDARVRGAAVGITGLDATARGDVAASPEKNEYRIKGFTLEVKGTKEKQALQARVAAPELVVTADAAKGAALTADVGLKDAARELQASLKVAGVQGSAKALALSQIVADVNLTEAGKPAVKIPISGTARADLEKQTATTELQAKFDESTIQAKLGLAKFSPPAYRFDVAVDRLNLDRYFPPEKEPVSTPSEGQAGEKPAAQAKPQADTPLDLSFLEGLDASGSVRLGNLQARGLQLANVKLEPRAANGRLEMPHSAHLYEGTASGMLAAQADGRVAVKETLNGVSIGPLLRDFAQKDTLEGRGTVALDVAGAGATVNALKKSLDGTARVNLRDGAIKGINLAEIFRRVRTTLAQQSAREEARQAQKTDFTELVATFTIKDGVAHNEDLDVKAPLFRITGKGDIDLGNSRIDYVTRAAFVATTKGQGGAELAQLSGLVVPVRLSGPFDALKYQVDYSGAATEFARSKAGERLRGRLEERLGLSRPGEKTDAPPAGQGGSTDSRLRELERLRGLLGR